MQNIHGQYVNASAVYRTGARCMMTYLAQHTNMLPSNLEISHKQLAFEGSRGEAGMPRKLGKQNHGGYADIARARMFDVRINKEVFVAVKSIKGCLTDETQQVRWYRFTHEGGRCMLIPLCRNCTERSSPAGPSVIHGSCLSLGSHTRSPMAACRS